VKRPRGVLVRWLLPSHTGPAICSWARYPDSSFQKSNMLTGQLLLPNTIPLGMVVLVVLGSAMVSISPGRLSSVRR